VLLGVHAGEAVHGRKGQPRLLLVLPLEHQLAQHGRASHGSSSPVELLEECRTHAAAPRPRQHVQRDLGQVLVVLQAERELRRADGRVVLDGGQEEMPHVGARPAHGSGEADPRARDAVGTVVGHRRQLDGVPGAERRIVVRVDLDDSDRAHRPSQPVGDGGGKPISVAGMLEA
jgi:hypothetical protein